MKSNLIIAVILLGAISTPGYAQPLEQTDVLAVDAIPLSTEELSSLRGAINLAFEVPDLLALRLLVREGNVAVLTRFVGGRGFEIFFPPRQNGSVAGGG